MTAKRADLNYRKDLILGLVVNEYIKTINPVSSAHIVNEYQLDYSPATIRNMLAELEREGFLTHPHTSAGRVPTQSGYRYYVDNLMHEIQLLEDEKLRIKEQYNRQVRDLERLLEQTSQVVSDMTHYTSIVSVDGREDRLYCRGTGNVMKFVTLNELNDIATIQALLKAIEEKERILSIINRDLEKKIQIYIGHEMACSFMEDCSLAVSRYRLEDGLSGRIAVLGPTRMDYQRVVSTLEYVSDIIQSIR